MDDKDQKQFLTGLSDLVRARYPLILMNTHEEGRCLGLIEELCQTRKSKMFRWSRTGGIETKQKSIADVRDPLQALKWIEELNEKAIIVLCDFHPYLKEPTVVRKIRDLADSLKQTQKNVVFLSPVFETPAELAKEITLLDVPLPSRKEIRSLIDKAAAAQPQNQAFEQRDLEELTDAASGLTFQEIENVLAKSLVSQGALSKHLIHEEKQQIVKKSGLLEFIDCTKTVDIGGLDHLKSWLTVRKKGLTQEARDVGLPAPKGILLVGIPGCGKSLTAMTVGGMWDLPLLRLDIGRVFSGLVGSSESNIRAAIQTCEAVSPCVLWIDEIEKGLAGSQSSGQSDGGTTSRVFGTILTWMQEKKSEVFVVATANDISQIPPEFLRKGRFDEIFFVDLPSEKERKEILQIHLDRRGWAQDDIDLKTLVEQTEGFSGSELEEALVAARYQAFGNDQVFSQSHILKAISESVPLSQTMGERVENLRQWARHRARPASLSTQSKRESSFELRANSLELDSDRSKHANA